MNNIKLWYRRLARRHPFFQLKNLAVWGFRALAAGVVLVSFLFIYYSYSLPNPNKLLSRQVPESTKILARDGTLLYEVHGEVNRTLVNLDQIPKDLQNATVSIEDKDFYKHGGISVTGLIRSVIVDVLSGEKKQGGSTITQQFVKNAVLTREKAFSRKLKEIILSIEIEAKFSKEDILKLYLNEIPYGRNAYGVEAASKAYFGKSAKDLTLAESAYLAALPQAPTYYNPYGPNREALDNRKNIVLGTMKEQGYITEDQYNEAKDVKVEFNKIRTSILAPHFVFYVQDYLAETYGEKTLQEGGLRVYTTLDTKLQTIAESAVKDELGRIGTKYNAHNAALIAIDPKTGQILAMVGGKDYFADSEPAGCVAGSTCTFEGNVNVATAQRQPGSSFKPFVYVTAFKKEHGFAPASMLMDVVTNFGDYTPHNFNGNQYGPVSMRQALAGSLNIPAVKTLALVGVEDAVQTARDLGITSPLKDCGLSLVLGGCEVKLIDHTAAYSVLANGGKRNEKTPILKIEAADGEILEEFKQDENQVIDPQAVYQLTSIMTDNAARSYIFGGSSPLILPGRLVAAKTGTTNNFKDGWTMGFTPSLAAGVWTGNNNGNPLKADAVQIAGPIWNKFMREALKDTPAEEFKVPPGIQRVEIDTLSGKLPTNLSGPFKTEVFADYNVPTKRDDVHVGVLIDILTGLPATDQTPQEQIITKIYSILRSERPDNPAWENPVRVWAAENGYPYPPDGSIFSDQPSDQPNETPVNERPDVTITSPSDGATISSNTFAVSVIAESDKGVSRVDISVDGESVVSLTQRPYTTTINKKLTDGIHTISARAIDSKGGSNATSILITVATKPSLNMTSPEDGDIFSNFPLQLTAEGSSIFESVGFYYQVNNLIKLISLASKDTTGDTSEYNAIWNTKPKAGTYKVFARSNTGVSSPKISLVIK